jgi:phosphopantetheinyl transferase
VIGSGVTRAETEVWLVDVDAEGEWLLANEAACPRLAPDEENRVAALKDVHEQRRRRATYIAQRFVLERFFGPQVRSVTLLRDSHGRPLLPPECAATGAVSLAHAGQLALIGCTTGTRIGVDLELPREPIMTGPRREKIERAAATLCPPPLPADPQARFLQAWVRLEALAKADGRGIGHLLGTIGVIGGSPASNGHDAARVLMAEHHCRLFDLDVAVGVYAAAVVAKVTCLPVQKVTAFNIESGIM